MWRYQSVHEKNETEFLDAAILRVSKNIEHQYFADSLMTGATESEPLFAESLKTPQDIRFHAEGPFLQTHVRMMLMGLHAVLQEDVHLIDIEEFRRLKGYEGETEELEEVLKENVALLEVFALCHDVAKWNTAVFDAKIGTRGNELGFHQKLSYDFEVDLQERVLLRDAYLELFHEFSCMHPDETPASIQKQFYATYRINVHYPHHANMIVTPSYRALLERFCLASRLTQRDAQLVEDLILHHMDITAFFDAVRPQKMAVLNRFAQKRGYDADDFVDLLQACVFLDKVVGSLEMTRSGFHHNPSLLIRFLKSEHAHAPEKRLEKMQQQAQEEKRAHARLFQQVGLDGLALLDLLKMEPGPDFGEVLRRVQKAVLGEGEMPLFPKQIQAELNKRVSQFYERLFQKGE